VVRTWRCHFQWRVCFSFKFIEERSTTYQSLFEELDGLAKAYPGWSLTELKELTPRERINWYELFFKRGR
jgi:hypothetical protein